MKTYLIITKSESSDSYHYLVRSNDKPTKKQLKKFLLEHGNDVDKESKEIFENVEHIINLEHFKVIDLV